MPKFELWIIRNCKTQPDETGEYYGVCSPTLQVVKPESKSLSTAKIHADIVVTDVEKNDIIFMRLRRRK